MKACRNIPTFNTYRFPLHKNILMFKFLFKQNCFCSNKLSTYSLMQKKFCVTNVFMERESETTTEKSKNNVTGAGIINLTTSPDLT